MESWQTAVVIVGSLVAGAALPVLVQLSSTLRRARAALQRTASRADRALEAVAATAERLDRATAGLDERRVRALMESIDALVLTVNQLRERAHVAGTVAAAVGPAVGAAVRAWRAGRPVQVGEARQREGTAGGDAEDGDAR